MATGVGTGTSDTVSAAGASTPPYTLDELAEATRGRPAVERLWHNPVVETESAWQRKVGGQPLLGGLDTVMDSLKRAWTIFNLPAGAARNFMQNSVANYLFGGTDWLETPRRVTRFVTHPRETLRTAWDQAGGAAETMGGRTETTGTAKNRVLRLFSQGYNLGDSLADQLSPGTIQYNPGARGATATMLSRLGIMPFAGWPEYILPKVGRGAVEYPERYGKALRLTDALSPEETTRDGTRPLTDEDGNRWVQVLPGRYANVRNFGPMTGADVRSGFEIADVPQWAPVSTALQTYRDYGGSQPLKDLGIEIASPTGRALTGLARQLIPPTVGYYGANLAGQALGVEPGASRGVFAPRDTVDNLLGILGVPTRTLK